MTIQEASERYQIPMKLLKEYERWGLRGAKDKVEGAWQYDDTDLERLSMVMTLCGIGFTAEEVERYMRLLLEGEGAELACLRMLDQKRAAVLEEIHRRERQLEQLDYLRYELRKKND